MIPTKLNMKFTFSAIAQDILILEMIFFRSNTKSFQQLSYSVLVIKLMKSEDICLNLRLTNYISLVNNLRDSVL